MSESKETVKAAKPGRKNFWFVVGVGVVLFLVYQSGRSSGVRSVVESQSVVPAVPRDAAAPRRREQSVRNAGTNSQPVALPGVVQSTGQPGVDGQSSRARRFVEVPSSGTDGVPLVDSPVQELPRPVTFSPVGTPVIQQSYTGSPVTNVPYSAPVNSVYDRRSAAVVPVKPSESGLQPLAPLQPVPAPAARSVLTFDCDCGKAH